MIKNTESTSRNLSRSLAMGVLLSIVVFYAIHVLGTWSVENYRPDPQTTSTVLLHNTCAVFGDKHTLRPNTDVSAMGAGIDGTKLSGSFMIFFEGHIAGLVIAAVLLGVLIFYMRRSIQRKRLVNSAFSN